MVKNSTVDIESIRYHIPASPYDRQVVYINDSDDPEHPIYRLYYVLGYHRIYDETYPPGSTGRVKYDDEKLEGHLANEEEYNNDPHTLIFSIEDIVPNNVVLDYLAGKTMGDRYVSLKELKEKLTDEEYNKIIKVLDL